MAEIPESVIESTLTGLRRKTSKMLDGSPFLRTWHETDDLINAAVIRVIRSVKYGDFASEAAFYSYAILTARSVMVDLLRQFQRRPITVGDIRHSVAAWDDRTLESWTAFHQEIEKLPEDCRDVFGLVWYYDNSIPVAAKKLGHSRRTGYRLYGQARDQLKKSIGHRIEIG